MKLAILSLNPRHNYGGILQAYALQTILQRMGHEAKVLTHNSKTYYWRLIYRIPYRIVKKFVLHKKVEVFYEFNGGTDTIVFQHSDRFISQYMDTLQIKSFSDESLKQFGGFVVGSDQVWRPNYFQGQFQTKISNAFLKFANGWNIKRISYAASFGTDEWEYTDNQTKECSELIKKFDAVSCREDGGVRLCKGHFGIDAVKVLDPTLLLDKEDYLKLITPDIPKSKGNLFVYVFDKTPFINQLITDVAKDKSLTPFEIKFDSHSSNPEERIMPPVESWLQAFNDAECVITDSFHACVFSIIFGKPFIVIGNKGRGMSRFHTLLQDFGLTDHMMDETMQYRGVPPMPIETIKPRLNELRAKAFGFLDRIK